MENVTPPLLDETERDEYGGRGRTAALVVLYILVVASIAGFIFWSWYQADGNKKEIASLREELKSKTDFIGKLTGGGSLEFEDGKSRLRITGDLQVDGKIFGDGGQQIKGITEFRDKVTASNPLVLQRSATEDEYLFQFKTGEVVTFGVGVGTGTGTDKSGLNIYNGDGTKDPVIKINSSGQVTFINTVNGTSGLQIQNAAGNEIFTVNTKDNKVVVKSPLDVFQLLIGGGSIISKVMTGTCNIDPPDIAAVSKDVATCAAAGVKGGDKVFVVPPTSLESTLSWWIVGVTDNDILEVRFRNDSAGSVNGASRSWSWFAVR